VNADHAPTTHCVSVSFPECFELRLGGGCYTHSARLTWSGIR
jgi:hypothetical protein